MIALTDCMLLIFAIVPGAADFIFESCNTTDDRLYIVVESTRDTDIYVKRIKHFVQYFLSKRHESSQIPITIIEPYKQKFLIISTVNSSEEILDGLDRINSLIYENTSDSLELSKAVSYIQGVVHNGHSMTITEPSILIAWFTFCNTDCKQFFTLCIKNEIYFHERQLLLFIITKSNRINMENSQGGPFVSVLVDYFDDFSEGNKIDAVVCKECRLGWVTHRNLYDPDIFSCYKILVFPTKLNWFNAYKHCAKLSASLAVVETGEELLVFKALNFKVHTQLHYLVHVGLTLTNMTPDLFLWTNGRPYTLPNTIERKKGDGKCVMLRIEAKNESAGEGRVIAWEMVDCTENITEIVVCERARDKLSEDYLDFSPGERVAEAKMMSLNKEFVYDESKGVIFSIVHEKVDIESEKLHEMRLLIFDCGDGASFVVYSKVCNCVKDCYNGRDEDHCEYFSDLCQQTTRFFCVNPNANEFFPLTSSIPVAKRCNFLQDCPDNSDENGCDECTERQCSDGTCVPRHWLSRDAQQCQLYLSSGGSLFVHTGAENDSTMTNSRHEVIYCNRLKSQSLIVDFSNLTGNNRIVWAPKCLFLRGLSGYPLGCRDRHHLQGCENFVCPEEFVKCFQAYCIPTYLVMDGLKDCPYGDDEIYRSSLKGSFVCNSRGFGGNFIHPVQVCDGVTQCPEKDDELNCHVICPRGFKCYGSAVMVDDYSQVSKVQSFRWLDINTKFLNLSGLDLSELNELYILPNLLSLVVSYCNLQTLDYIISHEIIIPLFNLDLSNNLISEIKQRSFRSSSLAHLVYINLSQNIHLSSLPKDWLDTKRLKTLDLSLTNISILDLNCITKSKSLRNLYTANTKLKSLAALNSTRTLDILDIRNTYLSESHIVTVLGKLTITSALHVDHFRYCCPQLVGNGIPKRVCHAPFDGISSCKDLIGDILQRSLLGVVTALSLVGNTTVLICLIYVKLWADQRQFKLVVVNLGIADFIMGVCLTIIASADFYYRGNYVKYEKEWRSSMLCKFSGFLSILSNETSVFFNVLITQEMILWSRFPFEEYRKSKLVRQIVFVASWLIGFILAILLIFNPHWAIYSTNGMCLGLPLTPNRQEGWIFGFAIFIVLNTILLLFVVFGQFLTFLFFSSHQMFVKTRRESGTCVAKQLSFVVMTKFVCWFPVCVTSLMYINGHIVGPDTHAWFVIFVLPLNSALNPIIFVIPAVYRKWIEFKRGAHSSSANGDINSN